MPRRVAAKKRLSYHLPPSTIWRIVFMKDEGYTKSHIARSLEISWKTVSYWLNRYDAVVERFTPKMTPGPKTKVTKRQQVQIVNMMSSNSLMSLRVASAKLKLAGVNVSRSTVHRVVRAAGLRPQPKPALTEKQTEKEALFCERV